MKKALREFRPLHIPPQGANARSFSDPAPPSGALAVGTGWGHLSERTQKRLEEMIARGVPRATAELTAEVMWTLGADSLAWSIFADIEADPPTLQLYNAKTGAHIECSNLSGPNQGI